jgi:trk system potassium uptake protein TrkA
VNIIIVGAGEVGRYLAESLSSRLHNLSIIESNERLAEDLNERLDGRVICGTGTSVATLAEANVAECELFLALTSDDNTNLVSASMAKSLGARKTIARVHTGVQREEWLFDFKAHFGIDYLFSTERLAAVELAKFVRNPERLLVEELARGRIELQQIEVSAASRAVGRSLQDLALPPRVRIGMIEREKQHFVPAAREELQAGDVVTLFGEPRKLGEVISLLQPGARDEHERNVVVFGGGEYGLMLAQMLEGKRFRVRIMEKDRRRCEFLANTLQNTVVIHGDATSQKQLREEQVGEADFFIAATEDDEDNVMTCLQAKHLGTKYTLALIHRVDYADVVSRSSEQLGIMGAVSPREAANRDLLRFMTSEKYHVVMALADGAEVLESVVREGGSLAEKRVAEVQWPEGAGLVALLQGSEAMVPTADDVLRPGDTVYAIVSPQSKKALVKLLVAE